MQEHARRTEMELENQEKEKKKTPALSHPTTKRSQHIDSSSRGQKGPRCDKCGKSHEGIFRAIIYYKCGKEGYYSRDYIQGAQ